MRRTTLATVTFVLLNAAFLSGCRGTAPRETKKPSVAVEQMEVKLKRIVLSTTFYCEGANFGDFNHDGKMDVVSGPYWYEGPDFSPQKRHEFMPIKSFKPDNEYSENFFAFSY